MEAWRGNPSFPARSGDRIILEGSRLGGAARAVFRHPRLPAALAPVPLEPGSTPERAIVSLPGDLPAGVATVEVQIDQGSAPPIRSEARSVPVATRLGPIKVTPQVGSAAVLTMACDRLLVANQSVILLVDGRPFAPSAPIVAGPAVTVDFLVDHLPKAPAAAATIRIRVDGIDSVPLPDPVAGQPLAGTFDPAQQASVP